MEFNFNKLFNPEPDASNGDDFFGPRISKTNEAWKVDFVSPNNGNFCWWTLNSTDVDTILAYSNALSDLGGVLFLLLSMLGLILNFLLIVALLKNSKIRQEYMTKTVVSIAINDFCLSILLFPCKSLRFFLRDMPIACPVCMFILINLFMISAFLLLAMAGLRCFALYFPLKIDEKGFTFASKTVPVVCWLLPPLGFVRMYMIKNGQHGLECKSLDCRWISVDDEGNSTDYDPEVLGSLAVIILFLLMLIFNIATFIQISKQSKGMYREMKGINRDMAKKFLDKEKRVGKMLALLTGLFFLVYMPGIILRAVEPDARITQLGATLFSYLLNGSLGVIDPLVFLYFQKKYRREILKLLKPILMPIIGQQVILDDLGELRVSTIHLKKRQTLAKSSN